MKRKSLLFVLVMLGLFAVWLASAPARRGPDGLREAALRWVFVGTPLMEVQSPTTELEIPVNAIDLLISFVGGPRVAVETFQCLLNGQDVTAALTLGRNGVAGSLVGLHEGENRIVLRVFGRSWWGRGYVEEQRALIVRVRPIPFMDVA
jgi:hypothetical protein